MVNETLCEKKYSIPDPGSHSRRLVNGRSQSPGRHGTTSPLVLSTHHQRPHPHAGPEDSVSPLTRLVSRAWYGIRHLTTPLRSIHLPVESPRKVGALESPLQLTRPHGWHSGALGSPSLCLARGVIDVLIGDKQEAVPMENPVFGFLSVISRWTPNLVNRPVSN